MAALIPHSIAKSLEYRTPVIDKIISDKSKYNLFFIFTHGELIRASYGVSQTFIVPDNTIVIQTGAGESFGCATTTAYDEGLLPRFTYREIEKTFQKFRGEHRDEKDDVLDILSYAVPGEETLDKIISLTDTNYSGRAYGAHGYWGVFSPIEGTTGRITENKDLTDYLRRIKHAGLTITQSILTDTIKKENPSKLNILVFVNCVVAKKNRGVTLMNYVGLDKVAGKETHHGFDFSRLASSNKHGVIYHPRAHVVPHTLINAVIPKSEKEGEKPVGEYVIPATTAFTRNQLLKAGYKGIKTKKRRTHKNKLLYHRN